MDDNNSPFTVGNSEESIFENNVQLETSNNNYNNIIETESINTNVGDNKLPSLRFLQSNKGYTLKDVYRIKKQVHQIPYGYGA